MKKELVELLACPVCKGRLQLSVEEKDEREVVTGALYCAPCGESYPIVGTIPNLLPPQSRHK